MSIDLNREKLKALADELTKDIKTEKDLNALSAELLKMTVERPWAQKWKITRVMRSRT